MHDEQHLPKGVGDSKKCQRERNIYGEESLRGMLVSVANWFSLACASLVTCARSACSEDLELAVADQCPSFGIFYE